MGHIERELRLLGQGVEGNAEEVHLNTAAYFTVRERLVFCIWNEADPTSCQVEGEMTDCVTCGMPYPTRTAVRHMERCYNKVKNSQNCTKIPPECSMVKV